MAITVSAPSVTTTATLIAQNAAGATADDQSNRTFMAKMWPTPAAGTVVYVGSDNTVTPATGWPWEAGDGAFPFDLEPGEALYGVMASGSQGVRVSVGGI